MSIVSLINLAKALVKTWPVLRFTSSCTIVITIIGLFKIMLFQKVMSGKIDHYINIIPYVIASYIQYNTIKLINDE